MANAYNVLTGVDLYINGQLGCSTFNCPSGTITNAMVNASAGIVATKLQHQYQPVYSQLLVAATSVTTVLHVVKGATATLVDFRCGSITAAVGAATVSLDLKKNGTTVLSAVVTLDNANTAYIIENGTLSVTSAVVGDVLTVVTVATAGGGTLPTGLFCTATIREDAA